MSRLKTQGYKVIILFLPFLIIFTVLYTLGEGIYESRKLAKIGEDAKVTNTKYFSIFRHSNVFYNQSIGGIIDNFVDMFYKEYETLFSLTKPISISIMLFKDDREFQQYASKELRKDLTFNSGFYNSIKSEIALITTDPAEDIRGLFHEITHAILDCSAPKAMWSQWLSEGIATYFEESVMTIKKEYTLGGEKPEYFKLVRDTIMKDNANFLPLRKIITSQHEQFTSEVNRIYYAESHTFVYFLLNGAGGKYRDRFFKYFLEEKKQGECPPIVFEIEIGDIDEIEKEWIKFILTGK